MTAPTPLTVTQLSGGQPSAMDLLTWTAADTVNGNSFNFTGREVLHVKNTNAGSTSHNLTVHAAPDAIGRGGSGVGDLVQAVAAGAHRSAMFDTEGWRQSDRTLYVTGNHAELLLAVVRLPT